MKGWGLLVCDAFSDKLLNPTLFHMDFVSILKLLAILRYLQCSNTISYGGVSEWLKEMVLKTIGLVRVPGVRIPPPPPVCFFICTQLNGNV